MGRSDEFHWVTDAEPHSTRRREILAKHGDKVRKLYGYDHSTAWQVRGPLCFDQRLTLGLLVRADGICYCQWTPNRCEHGQIDITLSKGFVFGCIAAYLLPQHGESASHLGSVRRISS